MFITDLIKEFRNGYDLAASGLPGLENDEIKIFLESAQYKIINQKFGGNNVYGQKFPDSKKRIDDLQKLMKSETIPSAGYPTSTKGLYLLTLPDDYLHLVSITLVTTEDGSSYFNEATQIDYSKIARFQRSKNNEEAYIKNPVFVFDKANYIRLYIDTVYEADNAGNLTTDILYITKPTVDMNAVLDDWLLPDFNDDVYHEIVKVAIDEAIFAVTPNKSQISQQQLNKTE